MYDNLNFAIRNESDCQNCTAGWYCDGQGLPSPTGLCAAGYFCSGRATHDQQYECPEGHKCPEGSERPDACDAGYFQDQRGESTCKPCPRGYYCNDTNGPVIRYGEYECIEGHYCPQRTKYAHEFKCPPGTFNNRTGAEELSDCLSCTGGYVCDEWGLARPNRLCGAGYFCREGANTTTPNLGNKADICPHGFYCPEGWYNYDNLTELGIFVLPTTVREYLLVETKIICCKTFFQPKFLHN